MEFKMASLQDTSGPLLRLLDISGRGEGTLMGKPAVGRGSEGKGPVWNGQTDSLAWTDIIGDTVWKWVPGEGKSVVMTPTIHANGMTYDQEGRLIVAGWSSRSVWRMEHDGSTTTLYSHYEGKKLNPGVSRHDGTAIP